ncbi:hypothetical protein [Bacillus thuringiensis]|uniref:hypothetical protein n=1 Tax=Bacillus thuringiensis TaxID=1428 RepID=UPI003C2C2749
MELEEEELEEEVPTQLDNQTTVFDVIAPEGMKIDAEDYGVIKQSLGRIRSSVRFIFHVMGTHV